MLLFLFAVYFPSPVSKVGLLSLFPLVSPASMLQDELHVIDRRTGRTYDIPIRHNAIRALDFAKIKESEDLPSSGRPSQGLRVLDEALDNVALRTSRITFLDSENGVLCYRGFDVAGLIGKVTWEEACHLLIWGNIPDTKALLKFKIRLGQAGGRPPQAVFTAIQDLPYVISPQA